MTRRHPPTQASRRRAPLTWIGRAAILALALCAGWPSPASAAPCAPTGDESVALDRRHYRPDDVAQIAGSGFQPSCDVDVDVLAPDGSATSATIATDGEGRLSHAHLLGAATGRYAVVVLGEGGAELTMASFTNGPVVMLDKGDYKTDETVHVTGQGYEPFEPLVVQVTRPDGSIVTGDGTETPGSDAVVAGADGAFAYDYVIRNGVVADYLVDVLTPAGTLLATTSFTDSGNFVKNIGTAAAVGTGTTTSIVVPVTATVTAGNSVIVGFSGTNANVSVACADSKGNTYSTDATRAGVNGSVSICSTHGISAARVLVAGVDTITVTFAAGGSSRSASANEFSGLASSGTLDRTQVGSGNSDSPSSGLTAATQQADEILFGAIWFSGTSASTFTAGNSACTGTPTGTYTLTNPVIGDGLGGATIRPLATEYRVATATGTYAACGTLTAGNQWAAAIATYKVAAAAQGQLKIVKNTVGGNGTFDFTVSGTSSASPSVTTAAGTGTTTIALAPGTYAISEAAVAGWAATNASCDSGTPASFTVTAGATVTCTFTNTAQGQIRIDKTAVGGNGTFGFTVSGPTASSPSVATSGGSGTTGLITVTAGSYSVSEAAAAGWALTASSCSSGTPASFTVPIGGTVTCSFTNTAAGTIVINKTAVGGNGTFGFTIAGPSASTPSIATAGGSGTTGSISVAAGSYSVSESTIPAGWALTASSCSSGTPAGFTVPAGGTVTCSFTNTARGQIQIDKTAIGGDGTFGFTIAGPTGSTPSIATSAGTGTTGLITVTAGSYSVSESTIPAGWTLTGSSCSSGTPAGFTVPIGGTVTCSFTNTGQGKIRIDKTVIGGNGTFGFTIAGPTGATPSIATSGGAGTTGLITVTAGSYTVAETTVPAGWALTASTCSSGAPGGFTVPVGGTVTCSFTNAKDTDGDGIPDHLDCNPAMKDHHVVDPAGVLAGILPASRRHATLQAAVIAAADNQVISLYANTVENVVIGASTGSGGKDLRIVGCGHKITALDGASPVIRVEATAGANDGNTGAGERDVEIDDLDVLRGSIGFLVETSKNPAGTSTLLKAVRATGNGVGIKIAGSGNEVRGANGVSGSGGAGVKVVGHANLVTDNRISANTGHGIAVTGDGNTLRKNKIGDAGAGNVGDGIAVAGANNVVQENTVFASGGAGITVAGNGTQLLKNTVGDTGKGNGTVGIQVTGDGNTLGKDLLENAVFASGSHGIVVTGSGNTIYKSAVGDKGKGNGGDGLRVAGEGNTIQENKVFANGGTGIAVSAGTSARPNLVLKNQAGDRGKGNGGDGIAVDGAGTGATDPVEIASNTVKANARAGIRVTGTGHQLKANLSGGAGAYPTGDDNGQCEFSAAAGNVNATGNKANGAAIAGVNGSAFPTACQGTP